jgi:S-DNA-T family DNA segregation ATPase FtsK/SpoIIIE
MGYPENENNSLSADLRYDPTFDLPDYRFPDLSLLKEYDCESTIVEKEQLETQKNEIIQFLNKYNIKIDRIRAIIGPVFTLFEIIPAAVVRISKIKKLEDEICFELAMNGIRIVAPIPGKGTIGIEVPNKYSEIIRMSSLLDSERFFKSSFALPIILGKTTSNETFITDLTKLPHLLVCGATGQGKSICLHTIITSLLYKKHPSQIKLVLIDTKKVELSLYSKIKRHFLAKLPDTKDAVISDVPTVIRTLNSLNIEMDSRFDLLQRAQVRNFMEYNEKFIDRKMNPEDDHHYLPYIILIIDEYAELMEIAGHSFEDPLTRLAQSSFRIGINLIISTSKPSNKVITKNIKLSFPSRIAFHVTSQNDSHQILDRFGAEKLFGAGDMLFQTGCDFFRLQGAFIDTQEIQNLSDYIGSQSGYTDAYHLPEYYDQDDYNENIDNGDIFDWDHRDELLEEAARLIVQNQQGSTSLIQRKLKLGYNRAGRIIDQLEAIGVVGPFEGSKALEVKFKDLTALEIHLEKMI